ncbi:MAG: phage protease, partial [Gemmatimonadota bacterium]|nr:phage protease [Gemmatimonadota bacterium]
MTAERPIRLAVDLQFDAPVLSDGSLWSHAATMGTRIKRSEFTIDKSVIENFIQVFRTGYPQKICVDYEHGTMNGATDTGQPVPAAGQVMELKGVYAASDFSGDLKTAAEKIAAKVGRSLDDPRNFGLWMRWRPTARALQMVTAREYTELSIAFAEDMEHNTTGAPQGPTILSVALTNTPFLDDMLPVAATRRDGDPPHDSLHMEHQIMPNATLLQRAAAFFGKAFSSEEEVQAAAEERINSLTRENDTLKPHKAFSDAVSSEVGESDPTKAATKIRELKAVAVAAQKAQEEEKEKAVGSEADKILLKHEKRLSPAQKDYFRPQLVTELKAGTKSGETKTEKVIESFPENKALGRTSASDGGKDAPTDR